MATRPARSLLTAALLLAVGVPLAAATLHSRTGDPVLDMHLSAVEMERRRVLDDLEEFDRIAQQAFRAEAEVNTSLNQIAKLARDGILDRSVLEQAEQAAADARARAEAAQDRRRAVVERLAERVRRLAALRDEIARRRDVLRNSPADPLSGRWDVFVNPGGRRGFFRLSLDGTILSGDYVLDGGFRGSLRGTFVGDRVVLERIDSERGVDAKFYGRLTTTPMRRLAGTWEGTQIAPVPVEGPVAGTWAAQPAREEETDSK